MAFPWQGNAWEGQGSPYASSGSGARFEMTELPWPDQSLMTSGSFDMDSQAEPSLESFPDEDDYVLANQHRGMTFGSHDMLPGHNYSHKIAPAWDGRGSWFTYEEIVQDWLDITSIDPDKRGPALRARMLGDALAYKPLLVRERLTRPDGVEYFLSSLRKEYVKDAPSIYFWRFLNFMKLRKGGMDLARWMPRYEICHQRLRAAWMDLVAHPDETSIEWNNQLTTFLRVRLQAVLLEAQQAGLQPHEVAAIELTQEQQAEVRLQLSASIRQEHESSTSPS